MTEKISRRRLVRGALAAAGLGAAGVGAAGVWLSRTPVGLVDGRPRARSVASESTLPAAVDVVVVGGGYVGTAAALTLAERGVSVALCEKGVVAGEASGRSMGYVDSQLLDPAKFELVSRSKALWKELNQRTEQDTGYRPTGLLELLPDAESRSGAEAWIASIKGVPEFEARILTAQELVALLPGIVDPPPATLYTPSDACVEPQLAAPAMAEAARRLGSHILQGCAVRGLESAAGRVSAVLTEKGPIKCQAVVLATGAWSPLLLKSLDLSLPQLNVFLSMFSLTNVIDGPKIPFSGGAFGFRPQTNGDYSFGAVDFAVPLEPATLRNLPLLMPAVRAFWPMAHVGLSPRDFWSELWMDSRSPSDHASPFEARRVLEPEFRGGPLTSGLEQLRHYFPAFRAARVRERWAGVLSSTPDNMPVIGAMPGYRGLYLGSAFTFGLTMGPAAGEALADLVAGGTPKINLHDYRFERFTDGSQLTFRG